MRKHPLPSADLADLPNLPVAVPDPLWVTFVDAVTLFGLTLEKIGAPGQLPRYVVRPRTGMRVTGAPMLTDREHSVLELIACGCSNVEIGRKLCIAEATVKTHSVRLFRKLGVRDRAQAVTRGFQLGLLPLEVPR